LPRSKKGGIIQADMEKDLFLDNRLAAARLLKGNEEPDRHLLNVRLGIDLKARAASLRVLGQIENATKMEQLAKGYLETKIYI